MAYLIDPELVPWLAMLPQISLARVEEARRRSAELVAQAPRYEPSVPVGIDDLTVPGPKGAPDVPVRVYSARGDIPRPGLLYIHGGAFVTGDVPMFDNDCLRIVADVGAVVVSVEYRLAPEHRFPAGVEDCYAALSWVAVHAEELGIDSARLGVGGESAGGGLAAAVALLARDRGGPPLCFQWLGIPELDDRLATPSAIAFVDTPQWDRPSAEISWTHYLGPGVPGTEWVSQYAAPARAVDLSGLPPAYVTACEFDPLRDEDLTYALRLIQAGVPTEIAHYPGAFHGSHLIKSAASDRMIADQAAALRRGLRVALGTYLAAR
jgi:acetyl esterase